MSVVWPTEGRADSGLELVLTPGMYRSHTVFPCVPSTEEAEHGSGSKGSLGCTVRPSVRESRLGVDIAPRFKACFVLKMSLAQHRKVVSAAGPLRLKNHKFKASLSYMSRLLPYK